jgi:hypothetical protein
LGVRVFNRIIKEGLKDLNIEKINKRSVLLRMEGE